MSEYLSDADVAARLAISRVTVWRWSDIGRFPKPVRLGANCTRWLRSEVEAWEAAKIAERDARAVA